METKGKDYLERFAWGEAAVFVELVVVISRLLVGSKHSFYILYRDHEVLEGRVQGATKSGGYTQSLQTYFSEFMSSDLLPFVNLTNEKKYSLSKVPSRILTLNSPIITTLLPSSRWLI